MTVADRPSTSAARRCRFGPLTIAYDSRCLEPRPWTTLQSAWAAELSARLPRGPILELCAGAGHIGLLAALGSGRALVQVEADPVAAAYAEQNAATAGLEMPVEVRARRMEEALRDDERFPLILADPPYLPTHEIDRWPGDPQTAIDGGEDGLAVVRSCLDVIAAHLTATGAALLQVQGRRQAHDVASMLSAARWNGLRAGPTREVDRDRAVVLLDRG